MDDRLNWKSHIKSIANKGKEICNKVSAAARLTWGFRGSAAASVYEGVIQPAMTYAGSVWAGGVRLLEARQLLSAQRVATLKAANAYRTVSTEAVLVISRLIPIDLKIREVAQKELITVGDVAALTDVGLAGRQVDMRVDASRLAHPPEINFFHFQLGTDEALPVRVYTDGSRDSEGCAGAAFVVFNGEYELS